MKIKSLPTLVFVLFLFGFTNTIDTSLPTGQDDPREADDNMRRIQAGFQEIGNVEHDYSLTGTEITGDGTHTDITADSLVSAGAITGTSVATGALSSTGRFDITDPTYGAIADGDGIGGGTNNDAAITAAIAAAAVNGGDVYVPTGKYLYTGLTLPTTGKVRLIGDGPRASELQLDDTVADNTVAITMSGGGSSMFGASIENIGVRITGSGTSSTVTGISVSDSQENCHITNVLISGAQSAGTVNDGVGIKINSGGASTNLLKIEQVSVQFWKVGIESDGGVNLDIDNLSITRGTQDAGTGTVGLQLDAGANITAIKVHIEDYLSPVTTGTALANLRIQNLRAKWNHSTTPTTVISIGNGTQFYSLENIENFDGDYTNILVDNTRSETSTAEFLTFAQASRKNSQNSLITDADGIDSIWPGTLKFELGGIVNDIQTMANNATPSVNDGNLWKTGGTTTITDFDDGDNGQVITIFSQHAVTITDGTNIFLSGSTNFVMKATDSLTLFQNNTDGNWYETSRSVN